VAGLPLERTARFFRAAVESLPDGFVLVVDPSYHVVFAAGEGLASGAWSRDELVGRNILEVVSEPVAKRWRDRYDRALAGEPQSFDYRGGRVDRDLWMQIIPVRDESGRVEAALLIALDVTQRMREQRTLRRLSEERRLIVDRSPIGLAVLSPSGSWLQANAALCRLLGYTEEELRQLTFQHVTHPDDLDSDIAYSRALIAGDVDSYRLEKRYLHRDGHEVWALLSVGAVRDDRGDPLFLIAQIQDMTAERAVDGERRALDEQLRDAQKLESLGILAGGVAHDFNNILVGVLGNASIMVERLPRESPLRENAESIILAAERAATLTQQMLAYAGKGRFVVEDVDLSAVVGEMDQLLGSTLSTRATLSLDLADDPPRVRGDIGQIRQVVMNLLTNAVEALDERAGEVRVTVRPVHADRSFLARHGGRELDEGAYLLLEVSDSGVGMDEATVGRIFEPFFTTKFAGRGLGLAATLGIVRGHGGALTVISEPGVGTTFRLLLPASAAADEELEPDGGPGQAPGGLVLVVDDDPTVAGVACDILVADGYRTLTAHDGATALEVFADRHAEVAAILLDVMMPGLDCEQIVEAVRRLSDVPIVLSSGYDQQVVSSRLRADARTTFIQKPYRPNDLRRAVGDAIVG
jgi:two-component system cell cycle sensor histidine kinase/response regulator CckA